MGLRRLLDRLTPRPGGLTMTDRAQAYGLALAYLTALEDGDEYPVSNAIGSAYRLGRSADGWIQSTWPSADYVEALTLDGGVPDTAGDEAAADYAELVEVLTSRYDWALDDESAREGESALQLASGLLHAAAPFFSNDPAELIAASKTLLAKAQGILENPPEPEPAPNPWPDTRQMHPFETSVLPCVTTSPMTDAELDELRAKFTAAANPGEVTVINNLHVQREYRQGATGASA